MKSLKESIKLFNDIKYFETHNDLEFFKRIYNKGDLKKYVDRLQAVGFCNKKLILDHGCGYGQWSFALSEINEYVESYDISENRISIANRLKELISNKSVEFKSTIDYNDSRNFEKYDGIFSYGVLQCVDYREMLKNYYKFLKPGGRLYFTAADLGWFLYYIIDGHNDTIDFSTRDWGIRAIENTISYNSSGNFIEGENICIPYSSIVSELELLGFKLINIGPDGSTCLDEKLTTERFFPFEKYNYKAVYEVLCEKQ